MRRARRRRRISLTSLIDVIFLLLLFFMLTSTFSRFSEVELTAGGAGGAPASDTPPIFLRLGVDTVRVNTREVTMDAVPVLLMADRALGQEVTVIVSMEGEVSAQRLTDLLVQMRNLSGVRPVILGAS